jgi:hypothetical protein
VTSAYPIPTEVLEDRVRTLAASLGGWPSQRRVMRECRVGAPRADAALAAVKKSGFDPAKPARPLTVVPDPTGPDIAEPDGAEPDRAKPDGAAESASPAAVGAPAREAGAAGDRPARPDHPAADRQLTPVAETPADAPAAAAADPPTRPRAVADADGRGARLPRWPMLLIAAGAFVAIWGGWVGLGELTGFGPIRLLPGIADEFVINSAITLPIGMEAYAAFALRAWLAPPTAGLSAAAHRFACWSALGALALGAAGQVAYHLMVAAGLRQAPWQITAFVSCLPVLVLACAAALTHLTHRQEA